MREVVGGSRPATRGVLRTAIPEDVGVLEMQGKHVGKTLLEWALRRAESLEVEALRLDSWHFNAEAHGFFRSQGFTPVSIVFEKQLPGR